MLDWQDLHHFTVVARLGSLTAAARELGVDHATVGRRLASLEAALGLKLIDRLQRSSRLTDQGVALAAVAMPMEELAQAVQRHIRGATSPLSGTVIVSALPALASFMIAPSLVTLRAKHPALKVVLSATSAIASLDRGEADISIGFVRPAADTRIVRKVGSLRLGLYANRDYARQAPEHWAFIGFEEPLQHIPQQRWLTQFAAERPFALRSSDVTTQREAARTGVGIAVLPCFMAEQDTDLVRIATTTEPAARAIWMSVHADMRRSLAVRATMDHLIEVIGRMAG